MAILTKLGHHNTGLVARMLGELFQTFHERQIFRLVLVGCAVDFSHDLRHRSMVTKGAAHGVGNFADCCAGTRCFNRCCQNISFASFRHLLQFSQGSFNSCPVACFFDPVQADDLGLANCCVVDVENIDWVFLFQTELVDADDDFFAFIYRSLSSGCGFLNQTLRQTAFDSLGHAA